MKGGRLWIAGLAVAVFLLLMYVYILATATEEFVLSEKSVQQLKAKGEVTLSVVYLPAHAPFNPRAVYREVNGVMTLHPNEGGRSVARISSENGQILWQPGMDPRAKGVVSVQGTGTEFQSGGIVRRWLTFRMNQ